MFNYTFEEEITFPTMFRGFTDRHIDGHHIRYYNIDPLLLFKKFNVFQKQFLFIDMDYI